MLTKIIIVAHPECTDTPFELLSGSWMALMKELKPVEKTKNKKANCKRMLLATSEKNIQLFAQKMARHLGVDVTTCDCLMNKGDFDCVDDYIVDGIDFLIVIAAKDVAEELVSYISIAVGRKSTHTLTMDMSPVQVYTV